jgi:hypothetical protein
MSNWTSITIADLLATARSEYILTAQSKSLGTGNDPVAEVIADTVSEFRGAVSLGCALDSDPTKIPNSLKKLAVMRCCIELKKRIGNNPLNEVEMEDQRRIDSRLKEIRHNRETFETPDNAGGDAEMQASQYTDVVTSTRRESYTRCGMEGML